MVGFVLQGRNASMLPEKIIKMGLVVVSAGITQTAYAFY
jgi:hypothetical protein